MKRVFLYYTLNGKESEYIQSLKDELESHGIQIYDTNDFEKKDNNISALHKLQIYPKVQIYDTNYVGIEHDNRIALLDTIKICDILIAFMKENDDSVIYSIGYAMAKDKKVLVVRTDDSEAPSFLELVSTIPLRDYFDMSRDILNFVDNC